jgi:hypothetical protein
LQKGEKVKSTSSGKKVQPVNPLKVCWLHFIEWSMYKKANIFPPGTCVAVQTPFYPPPGEDSTRALVVIFTQISAKRTILSRDHKSFISWLDIELACFFESPGGKRKNVFYKKNLSF